MGKRTNIQTENLNTNLLEAFIANQQSILQELKLLRLQNERIEAQLCSPYYQKQKLEIFYTTNEVLQMLSITRGTLHRLRKTGKIDFTKAGGTVRFTLEHIEAYKKMKELKGKQPIAS